MTSNFIPMFPSSSFEFNRNHQEFNEDSTTTRTSSSTLLDANNFKNNHFPSMITMNNDRQDESSNQEVEFHRKSIGFFILLCEFIIIYIIY